jgi:hypothetical protein
MSSETDKPEDLLAEAVRHQKAGRVDSARAFYLEYLTMRPISGTITAIALFLFGLPLLKVFNKMMRHRASRRPLQYPCLLDERNRP